MLSPPLSSEQDKELPVFVYGTLRPGLKNYPAYLAGKTVEELPGTVPGELYFVADGGYPYLLPGPGRVRGELLVLDPRRYARTLWQLDQLEEYDPQHEAQSVYLRRTVRVTLAGGEVRCAWVYYWNCPEIAGERIPSGDFRDRPA